ncbi:MAG: hypothetical protein ACREM8_07345, partial [Vulcanimicrobiaceae bacterium]
AVQSEVFEGAQCYFDHPTTVEDRVQPERSVTKLAGWFADTRLGKVADERGMERAAIIADFHPQSGNEQVLELMRTATEYATEFPDKSYIGFSINAIGKSSKAEINGQTYNQVDNISEVISVDIVTRAGARGKVISFQEAARMGARKTKTSRAREATRRISKDFLAESKAIVAAVRADKLDEARKLFSEALGISKESIAQELADANLDPKTLAMLLDKVSDAGIKAVYGVDPDDSTDAEEDEEDDAGDQNDDGNDGDDNDDQAGDDQNGDDGDQNAGGDDGDDDDDNDDGVGEDDMESKESKKALVTARRESIKKTRVIRGLKRALAEANRGKAKAENEIHRGLLEQAANRTIDEMKVPPAARPALIRKVRESRSADTKLAVQRLVREEWQLVQAAAGHDGAGAIARESGNRGGFVPNWKRGA